MKYYTECKNALIVGLQNKAPLITEYLENKGVSDDFIKSTVDYLTLCGQPGAKEEDTEYNFSQLWVMLDSYDEELASKSNFFFKLALTSIIDLITGLHKGAPNIVEYLQIDGAIKNDEIEADIERYVSILKNLSIPPSDIPVESAT